jgi:hypothetical protein
MAMGRQDQLGQQEQFWIARTVLPRTVAHPFYEQLNRVLEAHGFDAWVEQQCVRFRHGLLEQRSVLLRLSTVKKDS